MRRSHEVELELIGSIYDCVLDPQLWGKTVEGIRRYLELPLGVISIVHLPGGSSVQATANVPSQYLRPMLETADSVLDMWGGSRVMQSPAYRRTHPDGRLCVAELVAWKSIL